MACILKATSCKIQDVFFIGPSICRSHRGMRVFRQSIPFLPAFPRNAEPDWLQRSHGQALGQGQTPSAPRYVPGLPSHLPSPVPLSKPTFPRGCQMQDLHKIVQLTAGLERLDDFKRCYVTNIIAQLMTFFYGSEPHSILGAIGRQSAAMMLDGQSLSRYFLQARNRFQAYGIVTV